jgi:hypothetical protein
MPGLFRGAQTARTRESYFARGGQARSGHAGFAEKNSKEHTGANVMSDGMDNRAVRRVLIGVAFIAALSLMVGHCQLAFW